MEVGHCTFGELSFSKLFNQYIHDFSALSDYYSTDPFDDDAIGAKAGSLKRPAYAHEYIEALATYHRFLGIESEQKDNLSRLSADNALAVVTGQQLGILGGPIFTIYKTLTAIQHARRWEKKLGRPVVPVFWMADEDHDFEEIASFNTPGNDQLISSRLTEDHSNQPVSVLEVTNYEAFKGSVQEQLFKTDYSEEVWALLDDCFAGKKIHSQAFAKLMSALFSKHGVVIAGSNTKEIKEVLTDSFCYSIDHRQKLHEALAEKSDAIATDFHQQVVLGTTNLFYVDPEFGRIKIGFELDRWKIGDIGAYTTEELKELVHTHPERFSPNVFLRPIIQDQLLPTLGYVAGPGELAYYGQMRSYYEAFGMIMPVIFPRISASLIEKGIERAMDKLPFSFCDFGDRIEDLEKQYVASLQQDDLNDLFDSWKKQTREISENPIAGIKNIDPTLEGTSGKVIAQFETELDKLKGKVFRAVKQQEQTQLNRIKKVKAQLYPGNSLQERSVSFPYFMNKYGTEIWDRVLNKVEEDGLDARVHHIFYL